MIKATLADLRQSESFFKTTEVVHIVNGRKKEDIGYFIPISLKEKFENFLLEVEKDTKIKLLRRVAKASAKDFIGDGAINDEIK